MMQQASALFMIAAARGALDAGKRACMFALVASASGFVVGWCCVSDQAVLASLLIVSMISNAIALWLFARISIDQRLFATLAMCTTETGASIDGALFHLDQALRRLGWLNSRKAGRTLELRVQGVVRLLKMATGIAVAQWLLICVAIAVH